jgi:hypothetical protein
MRCSGRRVLSCRSLSAVVRIPSGALMRIVTMFLLAAAFTGAHAARPDCGDHPVMTTTKADGTTIGVVIKDEQLKKSPTWNIESGEPPLSISKAVTAAKAWGKRTYTRYDDVRIQSISLSAIGCTSVKDKWYYMVHFSPIIDGNAVFGGGYFAAVLMDGTVVGPIPVKRDF